MTTAIGNNDETETVQRRKIIELSQFVLSRRTEDIRKELYQYLVSHALCSRPDKGLTVPEIKSEVVSIFGLQDLPSLHVDEALQALHQSSQILVQRRDGESLYFVTKEKENEVASIKDRYSDLENKVREELLSEVSKEYPEPFDPNLPYSALTAFLGAVFTRYGVTCAELISGIRGSIAEIPRLPDFNEILDFALSPVLGQRLRNVIKEALRTLFETENRDVALFLFSVAQSYVLAQVLNLDPELKKLQQLELRRKTLFLDTNIIISLMCIAQMHEPICGVIDMTRKLQAAMVFTDETKKEFVEQFALAKSRYSRLSKVPKGLVRKAESLMEDPFIASFWKMRGEQLGLTWNGFCIVMESFPDALKSRFGVESLAREYGEIEKENEFQKLEAAVGQVSIEKTEAAARHDAYHIALIHKLRQEQTPGELGPCYWFLTRDYTLEQAEIQIYGSDIVPASVHVNTWLGMISPLLSPEVVVEKGAGAFNAILASRFPMLAQSIKPDDLIEFMGLGIPEDFLSTEGLKKAVGDNYVRQHLQQVREARAREEPPPNITRIVEPLMKIKAEEIQAELEKRYRSRIDELEGKVREVAPQRIQPKWILAVGVLCFLLVPLVAALSSYLRLPVPDVVYLGMLLVSLGLMAASVFGEKVIEITSSKLVKRAA